MSFLIDTEIAVTSIVPFASCAFLPRPQPRTLSCRHFRHPYRYVCTIYCTRIMLCSCTCVCTHAYLRTWYVLCGIRKLYYLLFILRSICDWTILPAARRPHAELHVRDVVPARRSRGGEPARQQAGPRVFFLRRRRLPLGLVSDLTPLRLETCFWGQHYLELLQGGVSLLIFSIEVKGETLAVTGYRRYRLAVLRTSRLGGVVGWYRCGLMAYVVGWFWWFCAQRGRLALYNLVGCFGNFLVNLSVKSW